MCHVHGDVEKHEIHNYVCLCSSHSTPTSQKIIPPPTDQTFPFPKLLSSSFLAGSIEDEGLALYIQLVLKPSQYTRSSSGT